MRTRIPVILAVLTLGVPMLATQALAEPPSNDTIENATAITALPYTFEQRISDANKSSATETGCANCEPEAMLWIMTAMSSGWVVADTGGSRIATVMAVYTGEPGALTEVRGRLRRHPDMAYSEQAGVDGSYRGGHQRTPTIAPNTTAHGASSS